jgi:hypothetical protein
MYLICNVLFHNFNFLKIFVLSILISTIYFKKLTLWQVYKETIKGE